MISLKRHIEAGPADLFDATARSYKSVLVSVGRHLARAIPGIPGDLFKNLRVLSDQFEAEPVPATAIKIQQTVDSELSLWADNVEQHLKARAADAREIMLVMAGAAQSLTSRDRRYGDRFRDITARLRGIADLNDLSDVRRSLMDSTQELNTDIGAMQTEGERTISSLEGKLQEYRKQLAEAERRECADTLTGLTNRRGIEMEIERRREKRLPFCVVLLDLDSFKPVNDTYGHGAGDDLLRQFAGELRGYFRPGDVIGRWGGDEFIAVAHGDEDSARTSVDRLRKWAFGTYKVKTAAGVCAVPLTASVGIAQWNMQEGMVPLLGRADDSMYGEKRATKKRCVEAGLPVRR
jgi:diguanylate cyclase (GGDEF)-like protein